MNALRMSHYPHAADWYELCDEMGILVMDELTDAWSLAKLENDYHLLFPKWHERDLRTTIRRHRNHPPSSSGPSATKSGSRAAEGELAALPDERP